MRSDRAAFLTTLPPDECRAELERMSDRQRRALRHHWRLWAHPGQLPPPGEWQTWLILAGRGYGKTRAGAEWVRNLAQSDPTARIALVGASLGDARSVMIEGDSGLLKIAPHRNRPRFEPSKRLLTWPNGAQATLYSAAEPETLRGPQHSHACRPSAKGIHRQRSKLARRCTVALRDRGNCLRSSRYARRGRLLAGRQFADRCLGRAGG